MLLTWDRDLSTPPDREEEAGRTLRVGLTADVGRALFSVGQTYNQRERR